MLVSKEAGNGVKMSCGDWTGATGEGWRAEVDFFSSEDFLLAEESMNEATPVCDDGFSPH